MGAPWGPFEDEEAANGLNIVKSSMAKVLEGRESMRYCSQTRASLLPFQPKNQTIGKSNKVLTFSHFFLITFLGVHNMIWATLCTCECLCFPPCRKKKLAACAHRMSHQTIGVVAWGHQFCVPISSVSLCFLRAAGLYLKCSHKLQCGFKCAQ